MIAGRQVSWLAAIPDSSAMVFPRSCAVTPASLHYGFKTAYSCGYSSGLFIYMNHRIPFSSSRAGTCLLGIIAMCERYYFFCIYANLYYNLRPFRVGRVFVELYRQCMIRSTGTRHCRAISPTHDPSHRAGSTFEFTSICVFYLFYLLQSFYCHLA